MNYNKKDIFHYRTIVLAQHFVVPYTIRSVPQRKAFFGFERGLLAAYNSTRE